jgi:hypothetical protein
MASLPQLPMPLPRLLSKQSTGVCFAEHCLLASSTRLCKQMYAELIESTGLSVQQGPSLALHDTLSTTDHKPQE